jgi:SpoVK/Ycf46/Vps4 family AAA+-type ATPase
VELSVPPARDRHELWSRRLDGIADAGVVRAVANRYAITGGDIERAATLAIERGRMEDTVLGPPHVHAAVRDVIDTSLGGLGQRRDTSQRWDDLVLGDDTLAAVREMIARYEHRRRVYETWGFGRKLGNGLGLSALFHGPPGTGKSMVAHLVARELGLDLYHVDLSRIVSKWVGETEKNLAALFAASEAGHALLLFDEADSLFAKRTAVKSSNDRYANLEVNYLLQRMEAFAGITVLTTNHDTAIDDAFRRRLSFRVEFPAPERDERERLWSTLLPAEAEVSPDLDFATLADSFDLTGGFIRNAVVRAAFLAADEDGPIAMRHLERAAALELESAGRVVSNGRRRLATV